MPFLKRALAPPLSQHNCLEATEGQQYGMGGHGGADFHLMDNWVRAVARGDWSLIQTDAADTVASHLLVFAAEDSRRTGQTVAL